MKFCPKLIVSMAVLGLSACSSQQSSKLNTDLGDVGFADWCAAWELQGCDLVPADPLPTPQEDWFAGIEAADELLASDSSVDIARDVYDLPEVQDLFVALEAQDFIDFVGNVSWSSLIVLDGKIVLQSSSTNSFEVRGLTITLDELVAITPMAPGSLTVTGVTISSGEEVLPINSISISTSGVVDLFGTGTNVEGVPYAFFEEEEVPAPAAASDVTAALKPFLFSENFDFMDLASIRLSDANLSSIASSVDPILPEDQYGEALRVILTNLTSVSALGDLSGSTVAEASLATVVSCDIEATNVPVLGDVTISATLDEDIGAENLSTTTDGFEIDLVGISTGLGDVNSVTVEGSIITISIGWFVDIEIDLESEDEDGPMIQSITCGV